MGVLEGRRIIVTGAALGIGQATAERFVAEGAAAACLDIADMRDPPCANLTTEPLAELRGRAVFSRPAPLRSAANFRFPPSVPKPLRLDVQKNIPYFLTWS